jgi:hypothetical protein
MDTTRRTKLFSGDRTAATAAHAHWTAGKGVATTLQKHCHAHKALPKGCVPDGSVWPSGQRLRASSTDAPGRRKNRLRAVTYTLVRRCALQSSRFLLASMAGMMCWGVL